MARLSAFEISPHYRPELDGLRAIAVLAVAIYHAFPALLPAGYLGVDVFFVLSGFVITTVLMREYDRNATISILGFYARRVRRLLPALLLCVIVTALLLVALTSRPERSLFETGAFALLGLSNIQLWQIGQSYFSLHSGLNPFTQTWSLAVEDQFYLIFPFLFLLSMRLGGDRSFLRALMLFGGLSLIAYCVLVIVEPAFAFYMLPTRFWELALGAIAALLWQNRWIDGRLPVVPVASAVLLLILIGGQALGGFVVIVAGFASAALLATLAAENRLAAALSARPLVWLGQRSYSFYLWHWSMLVIGKHTVGTAPPAAALLLILALLIAMASYSYVERPLRYARWFNPAWLVLASGLVAIAGGFHLVRDRLPAGAASYNYGLPDFFRVPRPDAWWSDPCHGRDQVSKLPDAYLTCLGGPRSAEKPRALFLIGDSHAAQLLPMARAAAVNSPFAVRFINPENAADFPVAFFHQVWDRAANTSRLLETVIANAEADDVVAIAFHRGHLNIARDRHVALDARYQPSGQAERFEAGIAPYLERLAEKGVRVILIADTPLMAAVLTSSACALQIKLFGASGCRIDRAQDIKTREQQDRLYARLATRAVGISVFDPLPVIYGEATSFDVLDAAGQYRMWDWNHITEREALRLAPAFAHVLKAQRAQPPAATPPASAPR